MNLSRLFALSALVSALALLFGGVLPRADILVNRLVASPGKFPVEEVAFDKENFVTVSVPLSDGGTRDIQMAKYEVTFAEWQACIADDGCTHQPRRRKYTEDNHPVSGVSWNDVQQYISWISARTGQKFRLPLESEWRAVAVNVLDKEVKKLFDDPRLAWAADYANFSKRAESRTRPVGTFGVEENGIADLAGNVWEWTDTCWRSTMAGLKGETTKNCGSVRILAGAHMTYQSELIRKVPIGGCSIGFPPANIGFRLVLEGASQVASDEPGIFNTQPRDKFQRG